MKDFEIDSIVKVRGTLSDRAVVKIISKIHYAPSEHYKVKWRTYFVNRRANTVAKIIYRLDENSGLWVVWQGKGEPNKTTCAIYADFELEELSDSADLLNWLMENT
jgi:hypothetical protein